MLQKKLGLPEKYEEVHPMHLRAKPKPKKEEKIIKAFKQTNVTAREGQFVLP